MQATERKWLKSFKTNPKKIILSEIKFMKSGITFNYWISDGDIECPYFI